MLLVTSLWQAIEIADEAKASIYRIATGYAVCVSEKPENGQFLTSFKLKV
jgi:hypothetical protein